MEYTTPVLRVVGNAQALVLGGNNQNMDSPSGSDNTFRGEFVIGLDE